jgi:hypothetical protein
MDMTKPTKAQIDYAKKLMVDTGYMRDDVWDMFGKEFEELTRDEMACFIDMMKAEREG